MLFQDLGPRKVIADFSGGHLSNDGGALLLQQVDAGLGISRTLAACFKDERDSNRLEHSVEELARGATLASSFVAAAALCLIFRVNLRFVLASA